MAEIIHIDQLLSNFATRYNAENDVAEFIAPSFKVMRESDKYTEYTKASFRLYDNKTSGREPAKEITQAVTSQIYRTEQYKLSYFISDSQRRNADSPVNLEKDAVKQLKESQMLAREKRVYDIAGSTSYITQTSSPSNKWDVVASGTPVADILGAMSTVFAASGRKPNAIVVPVQVAIEAIATDEYRDYFKYTSVAEQFNIMAGLRNLGLEPRLAGTFGLSTTLGGSSDPAIESIWSDNVLVFYRESTPSLMSNCLMFSPLIEKDRIRKIEKPEQEGVLLDIFENIDELLVNASAGYLFPNTLT